MTMAEEPTAVKLSPLQIHYLKKELIARQIRKEIQLLSEFGSLRNLDSSFFNRNNNNDNDNGESNGNDSRVNGIDDDNNGVTVTISKEETKTPFLHFVFVNFVYTFPFLQNVNKNFWLKIEEFLEELKNKNISSTTTRDERTKRRRLVDKIVTQLTLMFNAGLKVSSGEESIKVDFDSLKRHIPYGYGYDGDKDDYSKNDDGKKENNDDDKEKDDEENNDDSFINKELSFKSDYKHYINDWTVNIISVRSRSKKIHKIREKIYIEFIIQSKHLKIDDTRIVARNFKEFQTLHKKLKESFPSIDIPSLPSKYRDQKKPSSNKKYPSDINYVSEKNRQNLRRYLISLVSIKEIARSKAFRLFVFERPIRLTDEELKVVEKHKELDRIKEHQQRLFNKEAEKRTKELEQQVLEFKGELFKSGGLTEVLHRVRQTKQMSDLPLTYRKLIEYAGISYASTLYSVFIGSVDSNETFSQLKRAHSLMPYRLMRSVMKISNPVGILRSILDIFLAQPFGQKSLLQRILSTNLSENIRELNNDMKSIEEHINEPEICEKLRNFVYSSSDIQKSIKKDLPDEHSTTLIVAILKSDIISPQLSLKQLDRIEKAIVDYINRHPDKHDNEDNLNKNYHQRKRDRKNLIYLLKRLFFIYIRQRDKEALIDLLFQGVTGELMREIIVIFYEPLAKIYKAANIGDSLIDVSGFIDELIKVVDQVDQKVMSTDFLKSDSVIQPFVQLVDNHIPKFYHFVHSIYLHDTTGLFESMLNWIEKIIDFMRGGIICDRFDLDKLINEKLNSGDEIKELIKELDDLMLWNTLKKKRKLLKLKNIIRNNDESKKNDEDNSSSGSSSGFSSDSGGSSSDSISGISESDNELEDFYQVIIEEEDYEDDENDGDDANIDSIVNEIMGTNRELDDYIEENYVLKNHKEEDLNNLIDENLNIKMKFPDLKVLPKLLPSFVELVGISLNKSCINLIN